MAHLIKETETLSFTPVGWDGEHIITYVETLEDSLDEHCFRIFGKTDDYDGVLVECLFNPHEAQTYHIGDGKFYTEKEEITLISLFVNLKKENYDHFQSALARHENRLDKIEVVVNYVKKYADNSDFDFDIVCIQLSFEQGGYFSESHESLGKIFKKTFGR